MTWVDVGPADLGDGSLRDTVVGDLQVCLARRGTRWFAFETWCTHEECPLSDGWLEGDAVRCSCHGALFALADGEPLEGPARDPIRVFPARATAGRVEADLPMLPA